MDGNLCLFSFTLSLHSLMNFPFIQKRATDDGDDYDDGVTTSEETKEEVKM